MIIKKEKDKWKRNREGLAARICINKNRVVKMEFLPVYINDDARPVALSGQDGRRVVDKLGLELDVELVPAWDNKTKAFVAMEQYSCQVQKPLP